MPLYEILTITSVAASHKHVLNTLKKISTTVVDRGGVVRGIEHLGMTERTNAIYSRDARSRSRVPAQALRN